MKKKLVVLIIIAVLLTLASGLLVQRKTEHTLTSLGPLDDPICIESIVSDNGFPLAWHKGVTSCSENDPHGDVGTYIDGSFEVVAFAADTIFYFVILAVLIKFIPSKNKKVSMKALML